MAPVLIAPVQFAERLVGAVGLLESFAIASDFGGEQDRLQGFQVFGRDRLVVLQA